MSKTATIGTFLRGLYGAWGTEKPARQAAALAYYGMFSFAPMLYIILKVAGLFLDELALADELFVRLTDTLGQETAELIKEMVIGVSQRSEGNNTLSSLVSLAALLYASTGLFAQLKYSLNSIWHVAPQTQAGLMGFIMTRLLAFVLVLGTGLVLILAILGSTVGSIMSTYLNLGSGLLTSNIVTFVALSMLCFVLLYRVLPDERIAWGDVWLGAFLAAMLFGVGRWGLGFYLTHSSISSAFAAAGALAVILIAIYYSAQIFLLGAMICKVFATTYGSKRAVSVGDPEATVQP